MVTDHDVARLDVPVQHTPAVRVADGVADVQEAAEELLKCERPLHPGSAPAPSA